MKTPTDYFLKAYGDYPFSKKLYYQSPLGVLESQKVYQLWKKHLAYDAHQVSTPFLVPLKCLKDSGHWAPFKEELFIVSDTKDLSRSLEQNLDSKYVIRPETVSSIFPHIKEFIFQYGSRLKVCQRGYSCRNECTSRDGSYRMILFQQLQILCLVPGRDQDLQIYFNQYKERLNSFFKELGLDLKLKEIDALDRAHYSSKTLDLYVTVSDNPTPIEVGCLNNRGNSDLYRLSNKEKDKYKVFEISLGLDRILKAIGNHKK